ncbi:MAG: hypothetical protein R3C46_05245 [Hyphomonadaceae bacterium]
MAWLWIILRWLFPNDPVRQSIEAARSRIQHLVDTVFTEEGLRALAGDPAERIYLEAILLDYEAALHLVIGGRACQIAKLRFSPRHREFYRPSRAKSMIELLARLGDLVRMCGDIERLAQLRAAQLIRERDADPLAAHAPASFRSFRQTPGSRADGETCSVLQLQSCPRSAIVPGSRLSSGRAGGDNAQARTTTRGPPLPIVSPHPQAASQVLLRGRRRMTGA